jgi:hypothetical protein
MLGKILKFRLNRWLSFLPIHILKLEISGCGTHLPFPFLFSFSHRWCATIITYSLWFPIRSRLGQRHGHQSTTLTSLFYKNIIEKLYMYILTKVIFKTKLLYDFHIFKLNDLKVVLVLYSQCLTKTLSKMTSNGEPEGVSEDATSTTIGHFQHF